MASIEKRYNKDGEISSYKIIVYGGLDSSGEPIRRRMSWKPDFGMTPKQADKAVQAIAAKFEEEVSQGFRTDVSITFAEYAETVLEMKERNGLQPRTLVRYRSMLPRINEAIGHIALSKIRPQHLNELYKNLAEEGVRGGSERAVLVVDLELELIKRKLSKNKFAQLTGLAPSTLRGAFNGKGVLVPTGMAIAKGLKMDAKKVFRIENNAKPLANKTILEHHRLISSILHQAEKEMYVMYNAAERATPPKAEKKKPDYYQPEVLNKIIRALDDAPTKWKCITYILIDTGCRRGEVMGLKWESLDLKNNIITIERALLYTPETGVFEGPPKNGMSRTIRIAPETVAMLLNWKAEQDKQREAAGKLWRETGYVFTKDMGDPHAPDSITQWLDTFSKKHDLPHIHPHAFRHTVASTMIADGIDLVTAAGELGHADATTTAKIYAHQIAEAKAKAAEVRSNVFARAK